MTHPAVPIALLALAAPAAMAGAPSSDPVQLAQLTIHERIIIRVPRMDDAAARPVGRAALGQPVPRPVDWKEKKGPKCLPAAAVAGAAVVSPTLVDMVLIGGRRFRARLDRDCKPLDFYSGFYIRPAGDGMICADRDAIRVRSGASCVIETFRTLVPKR